jgi:hypothetical protein
MVWSIRLRRTRVVIQSNWNPDLHRRLHTGIPCKGVEAPFKHTYPVLSSQASEVAGRNPKDAKQMI